MFFHHGLREGSRTTLCTQCTSGPNRLPPLTLPASGGVFQVSLRRETDRTGPRLALTRLQSGSHLLLSGERSSLTSWTYMSQDFDIFAIFSARRHSAAGGCYNNDVRRALKINLRVYSSSLFMLCLFACICVWNQLFFGLIQLSDSFRLSCTIWRATNIFIDLLPLYQIL